MKTQRNKLCTTFHTGEEAQIREILKGMGLMANASLDLREGCNGKYLSLNIGISESHMLFIKDKYIEPDVAPTSKTFNSYKGCLITGFNLRLISI